MTAEELYSKGFELRCEGRYREAKLYLQGALNAEPNHLKAAWQLALIKGFEGDFDGSLEDLRVLAAANPQTEEIINDLAMTYMMLGYQDEACTEFHRLLALNPNHENALRQVKFC
jgi:tetratricopeptide (TPR) repeat protein